MNKEREIKRIWRDTFHDDPQWIDRYFSVHYSDASSLLLCVNDDGAGNAEVPASSMLLPRYDFLFHGTPVGMAYVSGAATRRRYRGRGLMTRLLSDALRLARDRGDAIVSLIPAHGWLFYYYERRGFARLLFTAEERYVAPHRFAPEGRYEECSPSAFYPDFAAMLALRQATVTHTETDFRAIVDDIASDGGVALALMRSGEEHPCAFIFAAPNADADILIVKELMATDDDAREAALAFAKRRFPALPLIVKAPAHAGDDGKTRPMQPFAMARVVNPMPLLQAYAKAYPSERLVIRLTDSLFPENEGTYILPADGTAAKTAETLTPDLDVDVNTLAAILFSSRKIGDVFGIHAARPAMTLMMD